MDEDDVRALLAAEEGQRVEFKASTSETEQAIEALVAFRNADGGTVLFGVTDAAVPTGVSVGRNTLENLANQIRRSTDPPLYPRLDVVVIGGHRLIAAEVAADPDRGVTYANSRALIRVGRTNLVMSASEQRGRLQQAGAASQHMPRFSVQHQGGSRAEHKFAPEFRVAQTGGDFVADLKWRFRGPRFGGNASVWHSLRGDALGRTRLTGTFDLANDGTGADADVGLDELGVEIRFHWEGRWQHQIYRFRLRRSETAAKAVWDVNDPEQPTLAWDSTD